MRDACEVVAAGTRASDVVGRWHKMEAAKRLNPEEGAIQAAIPKQSKNVAAN